MKSDELKTKLIRRISGIDDVSLLNQLNDIIGSGINNALMQLTKEQLGEIALSKKEIEEGIYIENKILNKEVKAWLRAR